MSERGQSAVMKGIGLTFIISGFLVVGGMFLIVRMLEPEMMQTNLSLLESIRAEPSHFASHMMILLGFCGMGVGAIGVAAKGLGWLDWVRDPAHEPAPGTILLSLMLITMVPFFGTFPGLMVMNDGPVLQNLASQLLRAELDAVQLSIALAGIKETNLALFVFTAMFYTGLIPIITGILGRRLGKKLRVTGTLVIIAGSVSLFFATNACAELFLETSLLSRETSQDSMMIFSSLWVGWGLPLATFIPFGWSMRYAGVEDGQKA